MRIYYIKFLFVINFMFFSFYGQSITFSHGDEVNNNILAPDEITFYSSVSVFSPVIIIEGDAQILWTWDDGTTSNSATPVKNYGNTQLRKNTLKVTPWSAVRRINVGYDAEDGGSKNIEFVENQYISNIENIQLVAPYLKEWCSSYSRITNLDFSNFTNLETIECYLCQSLINVNLANTPKLKRSCFELNSLTSLDYSQCNSIEEVRASTNKFPDIGLPVITENIWHMCIRDNPQIFNQNIFNDLSKYPNIADFFVWNSNQSGTLVIPKTNLIRWIGIRGYDNNYTSIDLRGSLQNPNAAGLVDMHNNKLTKVEIAGCHQIKTLDLSQNLLSSEEIEYILKQLDEFGPTITPRNVDLRHNQPITTEQAKKYKKNLEAKGWEVLVEYPTSSDLISEENALIIYPNPTKGKFNIQLGYMPEDGLLIEITNIVGQKLLESKIYKNNSEWSLDKYDGKIFFINIRGNNINETKKIIVE